MAIFVNSKKWIVKPPATEDYLRLISNLQFPRLPWSAVETAGGRAISNPILFGQLLWNRGLKTEEEIEKFLHPDYEKHTHDPFLFKDMEKAVERIFKAIKNKEKIMVFADYDADGISGAVVMSEFLKKAEAEFDVSIPDRYKEQYGLSMGKVEEFQISGVKLLITIDCGVTSFNEIEKANGYGMDVIILDHHIVPPRWPNAFAIIDHKKEDETYPEKILSGAGLSFKVAHAVIKKHGEELGIIRGWEKWLLDCVAIAAVADMVPLTGENRVFVKFGIDVLGKMRRIGLRSMLVLRNISASDITAETIGYTIAPRINAASRMDHANTAFELLVTENQVEADWLAKNLEEKNAERRGIVDDILKQVQQKLGEPDSIKLIFEGNDTWPPGVLGIAANRLTEKYGCPSFLYSIVAGVVKGSCRAPDGVDLVSFMSKAGDLLSDFGGHKLAGGFSADPKNVSMLEKRLRELAESLVYDKTTAIFEADAEIALEDVNLGTFKLINYLEPFGKENPKPLFILRNIDIKEVRHVGQDQTHVKMKLTQESRALRSFNEGVGAIYFRAAHNGFKQGDKLDILAELQENKWNGNTAIELNIIDARCSAA